MRFPLFRQFESKDCGPTCLRMLAHYYGKHFSIEHLRNQYFIGGDGASLYELAKVGESVGLRSLAVNVSPEELDSRFPTPFLTHWENEHFVIVYKIKKGRFFIADPARGRSRYTKKEFLKGWCENGESGTIVLFEPGPSFYDVKGDKTRSFADGFRLLFSYISGYRKLLSQLIVGMLVGSLLQLVFPFLTQSLIDFGVNSNDISFVNIILIAQLVLFCSRATVDFIRSRILLYIGIRINITLVSDFLVKLLKLPLPFFEKRIIGDTLQRIADHTRVQTFLTSTLLSVVFAIINLTVFGIVMAIYDLSIFGVFVIGSSAVAGWTFVFMKKRKELDRQRFSQLSQNQNLLIQILTGQQDIRVYGAEERKREEWEKLQWKGFQINERGLIVNQYQQAGTMFLNELKNIGITFLAAQSVIQGEITLGMMMAIMYIMGQINSPIEQLLGFVQSTQDAKLSLDRLSEIYDLDEEDSGTDDSMKNAQCNDIRISGLTFSYGEAGAKKIINNISLELTKGTINALVGVSGSGKTTLLKLLLRFYIPSGGRIFVGDKDLSALDLHGWRQSCGVVFQEGFVFDDTIAGNIAMGSDRPNYDNIRSVAKVANIREFIESLPHGYDTRIGINGYGLSQGQKQRILLARALYRNPEYLFLDEATSALDTLNERVVMNNLREFARGKTVLIVAHRLSTVMEADQIFVIESGHIVERGTHSELSSLRGNYFNLIRNQLDLSGVS